VVLLKGSTTAGEEKLVAERAMVPLVEDMKIGIEHGLYQYNPSIRLEGMAIVGAMKVVYYPCWFGK
jgi:hypothetical protein